MSDSQQGPGWWLASDGKWYPPQAPNFAPPVFQKPPKNGPNGCLVALAIVGGLFVLLIVVGVIAGLASSDDTSRNGFSGSSDHPARDDVELSDCRLDEFGFFTAEL